MNRENVDLKARRYLTEGRLVVTCVQPEAVDASVRGAGAIWHVGYRRGGWFCDCPARGRCAHLAALQLVTAPASRATTAGTCEPVGTREPDQTDPSRLEEHAT